MFLDAGTGNGMAKSLLDSVGDPCSPINAVLAIIRGYTERPLTFLHLKYCISFYPLVTCFY